MAQVSSLDSRIVTGTRVLIHGVTAGTVTRVLDREGNRGGLVEVLRDGETRRSRRFRDGGFELGDTLQVIG